MYMPDLDYFFALLVIAGFAAGSLFGFLVYILIKNLPGIVGWLNGILNG